MWGWGKKESTEAKESASAEEEAAQEVSAASASDAAAEDQLSKLPMEQLREHALLLQKALGEEGGAVPSSDAELAAWIKEAQKKQLKFAMQGGSSSFSASFMSTASAGSASASGFAAVQEGEGRVESWVKREFTPATLTTPRKGSHSHTGEYLEAVAPIKADMENLWVHIEMLKGQQERHSHFETLIEQIRSEVAIVRQDSAVSSQGQITNLRIELEGERTARKALEGELVRLSEHHQGQITSLQETLARSEGQLSLLEGRLNEKFQGQIIEIEASIASVRGLTGQLSDLEVKLAERARLDVVRLEEMFVGKSSVNEQTLMELRGAVGVLEGRLSEKFKEDNEKFERFLLLEGMESRLIGQFMAELRKFEETTAACQGRLAIVSDLESQLAGLRGQVGLLEGRLNEKLETQATSSEATALELRGLFISLEAKLEGELAKLDQSAAQGPQANELVDDLEGRLTEKYTKEFRKFEELLGTYHGRFGDLGEAIEALRGQLGLQDGRSNERLEASATDLRGLLSALEGRLNEQHQSLTATQDAAILELRGLINQLEGRLMEKLLEGLEGRITAKFTGDFSKFEELFTTYHGRFGEIGEQLVGFSGQLSLLEGRLEGLGEQGEQITALRGQLGLLEGRLTEKLQGQEAQGVELRGLLGTLDGRLSSEAQRLGEQLTAVEARFGAVGELGEEVSSLRGQLGLLEGRLTEKLQSQGAAQDSSVVELRGMIGLLEGRMTERLQGELAKLDRLQSLEGVEERVTAKVKGDFAKFEELFTTHQGHMGDIGDQLATMRGQFALLEGRLLEQFEAQVSGRLSKLHDQIIGMRAQCGILDGRVTEVEGRLGDRMDSAIVDLRGNLTLLEGKMAGLAELAEQLGGLREQLTLLEGRLGENLQTQAAAQEASAVEFRSVISNLEGRVTEKLQGELAKVVERMLLLEGLEAKCNSLIADEIRKLEDEKLPALSKQLSQLDESVRGQAEAQDLARQHVGSLDDKIQSEVRRLEDLLETYQTHFGEIRELKDQVHGSQGQLGLLEGRLNDKLQGQVEAQDAVVVELRGLFGTWDAKLADEAKRLEDSMAARAAGAGELGDQVTGLREQLSQLDDRIQKQDSIAVELRSLIGLLEGRLGGFGDVSEQLTLFDGKLGVLEGRLGDKCGRFEDLLGTHHGKLGELDDKIVGTRGQLKFLEENVVKKLKGLLKIMDEALVEVQGKLARKIASDFQMSGRISLDVDSSSLEMVETFFDSKALADLSSSSLAVGITQTA